MSLTDDLKASIKHEQAKLNWINYDDVQPVESGFYLTYDNDENTYSWKLQYHGIDGFAITPTHWMPLTKPE